jgi:hypothetical protein
LGVALRKLINRHSERRGNNIGDFQNRKRHKCPL